MRKYIIGAVAGALLMLGGQVFAEEISNIGKKVGSEFVVIVDGKELPVKAIGVGGSSYTPNRAIANAIGYDVIFENKKVIFNKIPVASPTPEPTKEVEPVPTETKTHNFTLDSVQIAIKDLENGISRSRMLLDMSRGTDPERDAQAEVAIAEAEEELTRLYAIKAELEAAE